MEITLKTILLSCVLLMSLCAPSLAQTCDTYSFSSNRLYSTCTSLPVLNAFLHWTYHPTNLTAEIAFRMTGTTESNWISWALNPQAQQMSGSEALVAYRHSNGSMMAYTTQLTSSPTMQQSSLSNLQVPNISSEYSSGEMIIYATLQLTSSLVSTNQVWQVGPLSSDSPSAHPFTGSNMQSVGSIDFSTGTTTAGSGSNSRVRRRNVHGVLNAVSWGVLMPLGAMIARYLKVFKSTGPAWFYLHVTCQLSAYIIGVAGWGTGLKLGSDSAGVTYDKHRNIGITLFVLGTLQVFALLLRPKPDHKYRLYWNMYHWAIGYATIVLSIVNIYEGFDILDPEKKWKKIYTGIIIFLGANAVLLEAFTWLVVLKRKKTDSADKHMNGANGANGYSARSQQTV